jgi:hypothetical protein
MRSQYLRRRSTKGPLLTRIARIVARELAFQPMALASRSAMNGARGWAPINHAAAPNTYTGKGSSKRD